MRRRLAMLLLVALGAGACSSGHRVVSSTTTTTTPPAPATTATNGTAAGSTSTSAAAPTTVPAGAALPAGFQAYDLTWVSTTEGWALGTAPCSSAPCTSIAHTLDGGRTWAGLPAPRASLEGPPGQTCASAPPCVAGIRFADARTGYAFGPTSLWLTTDGGHTWAKKATDNTTSLEIAQGRVYRVTPGGCSPPGCPYQVQMARVGSTVWTALSMPPRTGSGAQVVVEGAHVYVAAYGHTAGGAGDAHTSFARSTDLGASWSTFPDPCGTTAAGNEADASAVTAAPGGFLAVGCTVRTGSEHSFVVTSADAGASFGPPRGSTFLAGPVIRLAAATGQRLVAAVAGSTVQLLVSNDAGAGWVVTHSEAAASAIFLGFEDALTGRGIVDPRTVLTTTDGGGHWTGFTFP